MLVNIFDILAKYGEKGMQMYSPIFGLVTFESLNEETKDINVVDMDNRAWVFDQYGILNFTSTEMSECMLFPASGQHDWEYFKRTQCKFKPFEKVLVRHHDGFPWKCDFFSHYSESHVSPYECVGGSYKDCIPYEGNEELVGLMCEVKHLKNKNTKNE